MPPSDHLLHLYLFHIHLGFAILGFLGLALWYRGAVNGPGATQLRKMGLWMIVGGVAGVAITIPFCLVGRWLLT